MTPSERLVVKVFVDTNRNSDKYIQDVYREVESRTGVNTSRVQQIVNKC